MLAERLRIAVHNAMCVTADKYLGRPFWISIVAMGVDDIYGLLSGFGEKAEEWH